MYHILLPTFLLGFASYAAYHISDLYMNELLCSVLVALMLTILVMQCCKGRWKRSGMRRELLWRTYEYRSGKIVEPPDEDSDEWKDPVYMQGQSTWDIACAHAFVGCYRTDHAHWTNCRMDTTTTETNDDAVVVVGVNKPKDLMGCLWRFYTDLCCGKLCGCYLQICGMCAIAQEARDLELMIPSHRRRVDYVTMETWAAYYPSILNARVSQHVCFALSQLSIQILWCWFVFFLVLIGLAVWLKFSLGHVLVCFGVFLHAFLFMGAVHYIWHKHDVSFDLIVKAFSSGFFLSTMLAMCWETVVGMVVRVIIDVTLAVFGIEEVVSNGYENAVSSIRLPGGFAMAQAERTDSFKIFGNHHPIFYALYIAFAAYCVAALIEELVRYLGFIMVTDHPDFWDRSELEKAIAVEDQPQGSNSESTEEDGSPRKKNTSSSVLRQLPTQGQDRSIKSQGAIITVTMVAVSLGFACCENLLYVFVYNERSVDMEVYTLIARMIFPVHPICAAIQSIGIVRRDVEKSPGSELGQALLPAIVMHGTFDFVLMISDFINRNHPNRGGYTAVVLALGIVAYSIAYYFDESKKQRQRLERADLHTTVDQSTLL